MKRLMTVLLGLLLLGGQCWGAQREFKDEAELLTRHPYLRLPDGSVAEKAVRKVLQLDQRRGALLGEHPELRDPDGKPDEAVRKEYRALNVEIDEVLADVMYASGVRPAGWVKKPRQLRDRARAIHSGMQVCRMSEDSWWGKVAFDRFVYADCVGRGVSEASILADMTRWYRRDGAGVTEDEMRWLLTVPEDEVWEDRKLTPKEAQESANLLKEREKEFVERCEKRIAEGKALVK